MLDWISEADSAAILGLLGGVILGLGARIGRFCTLGAIEEAIYSSDDRRLRMWGLAIGTAIIGAHLALYFELLLPADVLYLDRYPNPMGALIGGAMFGYGMALCGNCGFGALARLGGGDLRSLIIVLIMGISAYVVLSGPLAAWRVALFPETMGAVRDGADAQGFSFLIARKLGVAPVISGLSIGTLFILVALANHRMLRSYNSIFWGLMIGLVIVSGWIGTAWISANGFGAEPIETHTFAAPIGDSLFWAMTASGHTLSFGVGSVFGVLLGAWIGAFFKGHFRWEACEDPRELRRQIFGAAIMGVGAILAMGCSIGQGIAAFSVLSYSAPLTLAAIFAGASFGLRQMIEGLDPAT